LYIDKYVVCEHHALTVVLPWRNKTNTYGR